MRQEAVKAKVNLRNGKLGKSGKKNKWSGMVTVFYHGGCVGPQALMFRRNGLLYTLYLALFTLSCILFISLSSTLPDSHT
jgi:hypothetical protein